MFPQVNHTLHLILFESDNCVCNCRIYFLQLTLKYQRYSIQYLVSHLPTTMYAAHESIILWDFIIKQVCSSNTRSSPTIQTKFLSKLIYLLREVFRVKQWTRTVAISLSSYSDISLFQGTVIISMSLEIFL